jgi:hypothetical protein
VVCNTKISKAVTVYVNGSYVSRLPFGGLEPEVSIAEKTMVTIEQ